MIIEFPFAFAARRGDESRLCHPATLAAPYAALREAVPVIDAAIYRLVRLLGGFTVQTGAEKTDAYLTQTLREISVGGTGRGIDRFVAVYFEQLLTYGTALGELVLEADGTPARLENVPLAAVTLRKNDDGVAEVCTGERENLRPVPHPAYVYLSVLNPAPGALAGNSLLKGLSAVSSVLTQIFETTRLNWERLGNVRFCVSYKPPEEQSGYTPRDLSEMLGDAWYETMQGPEVRDFVVGGEVDVKVLGADAQIPDAGIPVRQMLEQIVAKTGLPPFLLGLSWSATEHMAQQQADLLTSEMESYRRVLEPVVERIARVCLCAADPFCAKIPLRVVWDDITLADAVETARAALLRAQAARLEV
jgi:hypothetical protein